MFPDYSTVRTALRTIIDDKQRQGHRTDGLVARLEATPDDYEQLFRFGQALTDLPMHEDWPYVEPNGIDDIRHESSWVEDSPPTLDADDAASRVASGFLGRVCGCVLGKPIEVRADSDTLRAAFSAAGEWPIDDYVSERVQTVGGLPRLHRSWVESVRERLAYVPPDDDIHYTILGMLALERHGIGFTQEDLVDLWVNSLPVRWTFGPERTTMVKLGQWLLDRPPSQLEPAQLASAFNPGEELCGAMIRADAFGYASPGRPAQAAELAWRDASLTHRRTGIYGSMFIAAAVALAFTTEDPLDLCGQALRFVPRRSRFHHIVSDSLRQVAEARDWEDAYLRIHGKYGEYTHCMVLQEVGTLINTLRFASSVGDGICLQVMQGNDTDSFGATAGSLLGIRFGSAGLDPRWTAPFNDTIRTQLAGFHDYGLTELTTRMGRLVDISLAP